MSEKPFAKLSDRHGIARAFHEAYERLAPDHGYETRPVSRTEWENVPAENQNLMAAVVGELIERGVIAPAEARLTASEALAEAVQSRLATAEQLAEALRCLNIQGDEPYKVAARAALAEWEGDKSLAEWENR